MKEETEKVGLKTEDALNQMMLQDGEQRIAEGMGQNWEALLRG